MHQHHVDLSSPTPRSALSLHDINSTLCYIILSEDLSPMNLSSDQHAALAQAWALLEGVGLSPDSDLESIILPL